MIYGNMFRYYTNDKLQEYKSLVCKDIIQELSSYDYEYDYIEESSANIEYIKILKNMKKELRSYNREYLKAYRKRDKKKCLEIIKQLEKICKDAEDNINKINPDAFDTVVSILLSIIKFSISIVLVSAIPVGNNIVLQLLKHCACFGIGYDLGGILPTMNLGKKDPNILKDFNAFRNKFCSYFENYKLYLKEQRRHIQKW